MNTITLFPQNIRTLNFRDYVLWPIAQKMGFDPSTRLLDDQARAIGSYITEWVLRIWPSLDWNDWDIFGAFTPDPTTHYVPYVILGPSPSQSNYIGRVLNVYLTNPSLNEFPFETDFSEDYQGIFCGFDHGQNVWIRYLPPAPIYSAVVWDASVMYNAGDVIYWPGTGECYVSLQNFNQNHQPVSSLVPPPIPGISPGKGNMPLPIVQTQTAILDNPGFPAVPKQIQLKMQRVDGAPMLDPPASGTNFEAKVYDINGTVLADVNTTATGTQTLAQIAAALVTLLQAVPALSTFTISSTGIVITFSNASDYSVRGTVAPPGIPIGSAYLVTIIVAGYQPSVSPVAGQPQKNVITILDSAVYVGGVFTASVTTPDGIIHSASYTATVNDNGGTVLNGLMASIISAGGTDPVLAALNLSVDNTADTLTISSTKPAGVNAYETLPGVLWWYIVPFPEILVNPIVRGATADVLKEWGQTDKGLAEEQQVPAETQIRTTVSRQQQYEILKERKSSSRYIMR